MGMLSLLSCRREEAVNSDLEEDQYIRISAKSGAAVKGFVSSDNLTSSGTTVLVYDYLSDFDGTVNGTSGNQMYINGENLVFNGTSSEWEFEKGQLWQWTRTGTHNFFGFLTKDCSVTPNLQSSDLWDTPGTDISMNTSTMTFSIPAITFTPSTKQFDLCYSKGVSVVSAERSSNNVVLPLAHAFMGLAVTVSNSSEDVINLKSVELTGFKNHKSASLTSSSLEYTTLGEVPFLITWDGYKDLSKGKKIDLFTGEYIANTTPAPAPNYILMWPQTAEEVGGASITVKYTINGVWDPDDPTKLFEYEKELPLKNSGLSDADDNPIAMNAGTRYSLGIQFRGKSVELTVTTLDWIMEYTTIDYATDAILANSNMPNDGVLWLYNRNWDALNNQWVYSAGNRNRQITFTNGEVQGRFYILAPTSGQWRITTYPADAAQYFTITPSSGNIEDLTAGGEFTGYVQFSITPNGAVPSTKQLHFNVDIRMNGSWRNGNTEFNRKDWTLTREPGS